MPLIDPRHIRFVLDDVLGLANVLELPAFSAHDRAGAEQILEAAEKLALGELLPSYALLDANEPRMENGRVMLPPETGQALARLAEAGIFGMTADAEHGGLGLPRTVANAAFLWLQAANISVANYAMLTMSAAELLSQHGAPEQQRRYMTPMLEGRFFGTMALSEPQAGSSLGDITTTARPRPDGTYALTGTKMWISGGEHDMAENIVHLMLARIEGAAKGVKGISLFIVPRKRIDATGCEWATEGRQKAGNPGVWNNVALAGLNHKMGQRGTVNTVLNVGEGGDTIGEIVGGPGQGLACMFTMMNEARIGVSMGAVAHASAGFQHSLAYARERRQGRHPDNKDPASPQVPLIEHADVRRMLLQQKAAAEGGIALALYLAKLADLKKAAISPIDREEAGLLLDILTPVFKAWVSDECLTANTNAMQVLGGAGYVRDHPLEQHYRDNRLNPIHEGTNGIQALDLLGRKAVMQDGRAMRLLLDHMEAAFASPALLDGLMRQRMANLFLHIKAALQSLASVRQSFGSRHEMALAPDFMELVGCTVFAWIWAVQADGAKRLHLTPDASPVETAFIEGIVATAGYVMEHIPPRAIAAAERIQAANPSAFHMRDEWFGSIS